MDDGRTIAESSIIVEHLDLCQAGPVRLLPDDRRAALEIRFMDRFFDNHVMTTMQKPVLEMLHGEAVVRTRRRGGAALSFLFSPRRVRSRLTGRLRFSPSLP